MVVIFAGTAFLLAVRLVGRVLPVWLPSLPRGIKWGSLLVGRWLLWGSWRNLVKNYNCLCLRRSIASLGGGKVLGALRRQYRHDHRGPDLQGDAGKQLHKLAQRGAPQGEHDEPAEARPRQKLDGDMTESDCVGRVCI